MLQRAMQCCAAPVRSTHPAFGLTWCRRGVQVHLLAVLPVARLVAASHPEHIHTVHFQPVDHSAAPVDLVQPLPAPACGSQAPSHPAPGSSPRHHPAPPILDGEVPRRGGLWRETPTKEELVVGQRSLGVYHWSLRSCERNKQINKLSQHQYSN